MAITKMRYIGERPSGSGNKHQGLKNCINYILNPDKTDGGTLIGAVNCTTHDAYSQMLNTKKYFNKEDKRQCYHYVLSFNKDENDVEAAFDILKKFVEQYLGSGYEAVYALHNDTDVLHGHIVFNSVSFVDGIKYRYQKGDWKKDIQSKVDALCLEYGFDTLEYNEYVNDNGSNVMEYSDNYVRNRKIQIKKDIDECISVSVSFDEFLHRMHAMGYKTDYSGKYFKVKHPDMEGYRRTHTLGKRDKICNMYTLEMIQKRIECNANKLQLAMADNCIISSSGNLVNPKTVTFTKRKFIRYRDMSSWQKKEFLRKKRLGIRNVRVNYKSNITALRQMNERAEIMNIISANHINSLDEAMLYKEYVQKELDDTIELRNEYSIKRKIFAQELKVYKLYLDCRDKGDFTRLYEDATYKKVLLNHNRSLEDIIKFGKSMEEERMHINKQIRARKEMVNHVNQISGYFENSYRTI